MAMRLGRNWRTEALRARLARRLAPDRLDQLWPVTDGTRTTLRSSASPDAQDLAGALLRAVPAALAPILASNAWAISGRHTESGKPILANDPHLGLRSPAMWYLARLEAPGFLRVGATVAGLPFTILGHNGHIAWGLTNMPSDTQDLFVERIDAADAGRYLTPNGPRPFTVRTETIRVKDADDVALVVRETRHGPVISDARPALRAGLRPGHVLALAATALIPDDRTAEAIYRLNRARGWPAFTAALRLLHAPHQTVTYGDVAGNIGMASPGRVPVRRNGDGAMPVAGWTGDNDWTGFIPFDELPQVLNPPSGRVVAANQRPVGPAYPHFLGRDWPPGYRARRIYALLDTDATGRTGHNAAASAAMQMDRNSAMARDLLPLMLAPAAADAASRTALALLARWDGDMDRDRPEPLIFTA